MRAVSPFPIFTRREEMDSREFLRWCQTKLGLSVVGGGLAIIAVTFWLLFGAAFSATAKKKGEYNFMHCPACGLELPYNPDLTNSNCVKCAKAKFVATHEKVGDEGASPSLMGKVFVMTVIILVVVPGIVYIGSVDIKRERFEKPVDLLKCLCPQCKRKFAYQASSAGALVRCNRCKTEFALPAPVEE